MKTNSELLQNELSAFADCVNAERFGKALRDLLIDHLQTEAGKNDDLDELLIGLQRLYPLLDVIAEEQRKN